MSTPALKRRLSGADAAFLYLERKEIPLHIAAVCIFEEEIPFAAFVKALDSKLHLIPRYRQIVARPPMHLGHPAWEPDPHFNIRRHVFPITVPAPGGQAEMEALAGNILSKVMDRSKPLWDVHVINGLEGGRGAILARVHHALADGISGASLMKIMLDPTPEGSHAMPKRPRRATSQPQENHSVPDALAAAVRSSLESVVMAEAILLDLAESLLQPRMQDALQKVVALLPELAKSSERLPFNRPCGGDRKFCWTEFPLGEAQAIREKAGGKLNDVVLTVLTRAIARYVQLHGEGVKGRFVRVVCPVSSRQDDKGESLGNQISFLPVALPLDVRDPRKLLAAVGERTEVMKSVKVAHLVGLLAAWLGAMPAPVQEFFWNVIPTINLPFPLLNLIATNVPGSPTPLYAVGKRMIASYPHVPTGYELGVNFAVQSYDGKLYCGFTADAGVVPDVEKLRDYTAEAFRELSRAAARNGRHSTKS